MSVCTQCGQPLGVGRFCTNCGHPVDESGPVSEETSVAVDEWRTDTAERPAVQEVEHTIRRQRPILPPPVTTPSEPPRYPLFADEAPPRDGRAGGAMGAGAAPPDQVTPTQAFRHVGDRPPRRSVGWVPWAAGAVVLLLMTLIGVWLLLSGGDDGSPAADDTTASDTTEPSPDTSEPEPSDEGGQGTGSAGKPEDISRTATASAPKTAPPGEDVDGNVVRFDARQMLDGVPETAWRMAGDGTGDTLTFALPGPTAITEVGMINGYAKTSTDGGRRLDWYDGNRRVLAVEWIFDDGTAVEQDLDETRNLQTVQVSDVTTETVKVRLVEVSKPGGGPAGRNYTAVSEVALFGRPA
jgi:hypothetical protein